MVSVCYLWRQKLVDDGLRCCWGKDCEGNIGDLVGDLVLLD